MWVKICATTSLADALLAAELGADAVGFVFAPSPRQVTIAQVAAITARLPDRVERVGVFAGLTESNIERVAIEAQAAGLSSVQLHGAVPLELASMLKDRLGDKFDVIQTAHWRLGADVASEAEVRAQMEELAAELRSFRLLVDAKVGTLSGGLGVPFDWAYARNAIRSVAGVRVIVAGGLTPENVNEALTQLRPYGVDVASGVEEKPGIKDAKKLAAFIRAARETA